MQLRYKPMERRGYIPEQPLTPTQKVAKAADTAGRVIEASTHFIVDMLTPDGKLEQKQPIPQPEQQVVTPNSDTPEGLSYVRTPDGNFKLIPHEDFVATYGNNPAEVFPMERQAQEDRANLANVRAELAQQTTTSPEAPVPAITPPVTK